MCKTEVLLRGNSQLSILLKRWIPGKTLDNGSIELFLFKTMMIKWVGLFCNAQTQNAWKHYTSDNFFTSIAST